MNVRLKYSTYFTAGVHYNDQIMFNNYKVVMYLLTGISSGDDHNVALERIKFMINHQLSNGIFINQQNAEKCRALTVAGVKVINLPEEPVDQVVGMMLYSKLNAIAENKLLITDIEVSSELGEHICYLHCDEENLGPFADEGWWNSSDPNYCDATLIDDKVVALTRGELWRDLGLEWGNTESPTDQDNTVVFADFHRDDRK